MGDIHTSCITSIVSREGAKFPGFGQLFPDLDGMLEVMRSNLLGEEGNYDASLATYSRVRDRADQLGDASLRARAERVLATIYGRRDQLEQAIAHATRAVSIYERLGDRLSLEKMRSTLSSIYVQAREFQIKCGQVVAAVAHFSASIEHARQNDNHYMAAFTPRGLGETYCQTVEAAAGGEAKGF